MRYSPSPIDFDHPLDYQLLDGERDVFGDGQVVIIPTYGHTPGHQSVRVRAGKGTDLVARRGRLLHAGEHGPRRAAQHPLGSRGDVAVAGQRCGHSGTGRGPSMIYGHDVAQWQEMRRAPTPLV